MGGNDIKITFYILNSDVFTIDHSLVSAGNPLRMNTYGVEISKN